MRLDGRPSFCEAPSSERIVSKCSAGSSKSQVPGSPFRPLLEAEAAECAASSSCQGFTLTGGICSLVLAPSTCCPGRFEDFVAFHCCPTSYKLGRRVFSCSAQCSLRGDATQQSDSFSFAPAACGEAVWQFALTLEWQNSEGQVHCSAFDFSLTMLQREQIAGYC